MTLKHLFRKVIVAFQLTLFLCGNLAFSQDATLQLPKKGHLYFHRYSSYDAWDGQIWRYDLASGQGVYLSKDWPIDHAMNVRFDRSGKQMVFMGVQPGQHRSNAWDIFLWRVGSKEIPTNLTEGNKLRDEDPQFSPDGSQIVFKQDGKLALMNVANRAVKRLGPDEKSEQSMPIFVDDHRIVFMDAAAESGSLQVYDLAARKSQPLFDTPNVQDYFPVAWDARRFLFVRWVSPTDHHDQIHQYVWSSDDAYKLPFCNDTGDYSDPCPIDERYVLFSSTRPGSQGGYDLFLGDALTGEVKEIKIPGINTKGEELASVYRPVTPR